jgi:hypothetical protein
LSHRDTVASTIDSPSGGTLIEIMWGVQGREVRVARSAGGGCAAE